MSLTGDYPDFSIGQGGGGAIVQQLNAQVIPIGGQSFTFYVGAWNSLTVRVSGPSPGLDAYPVDFAFSLDAAGAYVVGTTHMEIEPTLATRECIPVIAPYVTITYGAGTGGPAQGVTAYIYGNYLNPPSIAASIDPIVLMSLNPAVGAGAAVVVTPVQIVRGGAVLTVSAVAATWFVVVYRVSAAGANLGPIAVMSSALYGVGGSLAFNLPAVRCQVQISNTGGAATAINVSILLDR